MAETTAETPVEGEESYDEITTFDHALTQPWKIVKNYIRESRPVVWFEAICSEGNVHVSIGGEQYMLGSDGLLMPFRKGQPGPDLRFFKQ